MVRSYKKKLLDPHGPPYKKKLLDPHCPPSEAGAQKSTADVVSRWQSHFLNQGQIAAEDMIPWIWPLLQVVVLARCISAA